MSRTRFRKHLDLFDVIINVIGRKLSRTMGSNETGAASYPGRYQKGFTTLVVVIGMIALMFVLLHEVLTRH